MRIGRITEVIDKLTGTVIFNIPKYVDEGIAYSLFKEKIPVEGEEIMLFRMNSNLGSLWYYLNISRLNRLSFDVNNNSIKITEDGNIAFGSSNVMVDDHNNITDDYQITSPDDYRVLYRPLNQLLNYLISALFRLKIQNPDGTIGSVSPISLNDLNILKQQINKIKDRQSWVIYPKSTDGEYNSTTDGLDAHTINFS